MKNRALLVFTVFLSLTAWLGAGCASSSPIHPAASTAAKSPSNDRGNILTEEDFPGGYGLQLYRPNEKEETFRVRIHPNLPPYVFHVVSFSASPTSSIEIFHSTTDTKPFQTIPLDPNARFGEMSPVFFTVQDINFDEFSDIGVPQDGGAKWTAYQYWTFDPKTGTFVSSPAAKDMLKIGYNFISFDKTKKQITTDNLEGAGSRRLYQFQKGHILPIKGEDLDTIQMSMMNPSVNGPFVYHCVITTITYPHQKPHLTKKELPVECNRSMQSIPFVYPAWFPY
jgi:hypothetical protein